MVAAAEGKARGGESVSHITIPIGFALIALAGVINILNDPDRWPSGALLLMGGILLCLGQFGIWQ